MDIDSIEHRIYIIRGQRVMLDADLATRRCLAASPGLAERMLQAESRLDGHQAVLGEHAQAIREVFADIRKLIEPPVRRPRQRRRSAAWLQVMTTVRRPPR